MSLIFRMLYIYFSSFFKPRLPVGKATSVLMLHVLPNDLDINLHMNNGRYMTICDLNRVDLFIRTGLARTMIRKKWISIIAEHTMSYKKPLRVFQEFMVSMEITHWDEKGFYMNHIFKVGTRVVAQGTSFGMIRGKEGVITPKRVIETVKMYHKNLR